MSSSSKDENRRRQLIVEVIMPRPNPEGGAGASSSVALGGAGLASSAAPDVSALVEKGIVALPPELDQQAKDPKRKARSQDPGWKYGWWLDPTKKEFIQCIFCKKVVPVGIGQFKMHLARGYGDAVKCPKPPPIVQREMTIYLKKNTRTTIVALPGDGEQEQEANEKDEVTEVEPAKVPSYGTRLKREQSEAKKKIAQAVITSFVVVGHTKAATQKNTNTKSVSAMLRRTLEEVFAERHKSKTSQPTIKQCTKKDKEAKQIVDDHVVDFFYENGIPFNVINLRSWEIILESIRQYRHGYRSPTMHDIRKPLLERAVNRTTELRKKHEESWKEYDCTLMFDGWTDTSHCHIINFLDNSLAGTFFLGSVDASSEIANAQMLADLL
ncbi:uncharacterized protein [Miscanthus floridulus]|uniref:uncharacterized protein n=1 Tax=Miscanthus floridulus TaxID=154761 RepID=UPI00345B04E7